MPAKALEIGGLVKLMIRSFRQVGIGQGNVTLRNIRVGKYCVLV